MAFANITWNFAYDKNETNRNCTFVEGFDKIR